MTLQQIRQQLTHLEETLGVEEFFTQAEILMNQWEKAGYITPDEYCQLEMDYGF